MRLAIQKKIESVKKLISLINEYSLIGIIKLESLPSKQLQSLRQELKDKLRIIITKKNNVLRALKEVEKTKKNISKLMDYYKGACGLIFSNDDAFKISLLLAKKVTSAPAKAGQEAPIDIVVQAGPTPFTPGPIISELASVGIKTKAEQGKLIVINDITVAKAGEAIRPELASVLLRMGFQPMSIGLNLRVVYQDGKVFAASDLKVDVNEIIGKLGQAYSRARNLAFDREIFVPEIMSDLLVKAQMDAINLALNANILNKKTIDYLLSKAESEAKALASIINLEGGKA